VPRGNLDPDYAFNPTIAYSNAKSIANFLASSVYSTTVIN